MHRIGIAFTSKDRVHAAKLAIEPLLLPNKFDLHWIDGSNTEEGKAFVEERWKSVGMPFPHKGIRGGSGPAIVYALTTMLGARMNKDVSDKTGSRWWLDYTHIGLVEQDVLLGPNWFDDMMALFERGKQDGLEVGAVSARCYEDRILVQKDGYAVCHNIGAGMIMFTRQAAELVLQNYRTVWTTENRLLFSQLSGLDIGRWWAFRGEQHFLVSDWRFDMVLAAHGLASLALTPNRATMLDQDIGPLGLKYADGNFELARNPAAFETYRDNLTKIREGKLKPGVNHPFFYDGQVYTIFAHQIPQLGGSYSGDWRIRDFQGFGPFVWRAGKGLGGRVFNEVESHQINPPKVTIPVVGSCDLIVSGGKNGSRVRVEDTQSGFNVEVMVNPETDMGQVMQLAVPGAAVYREVVLTALDPGVCFFGIRAKEPQPHLPNVRFDYNTLPPV